MLHAEEVGLSFCPCVRVPVRGLTENHPPTRTLPRRLKDVEL